MKSEFLKGTGGEGISMYFGRCIKGKIGAKVMMLSYKRKSSHRETILVS
jgi:hypothetical protein